MNLRFCGAMEQQDKLAQLQADLHDAEVSDEGLYGALRNKDREAVGGAIAASGIGPHSESAVQRHLRGQGLTPVCLAGVVGTRKYDSCESLEDASRRSEEHRQEFLDQTALQDSIQQQEATCRATMHRRRCRAGRLLPGEVGVSVATSGPGACARPFVHQV